MITAFIIESYKNLQVQPEDLTNQILLHLSNQVSNLVANGNFVNSAASAFTAPSFQKSKAMIIINTLWFLSLTIAFITVSLGILVKQWFHELLAYDTHDPMERLKLRFFREAGLERWKVFAIASLLPVLLQLALLLFFIGLGVFLRQLDPVVAWVTNGVMILWLITFLFTITVPAFSSQCPYKIPILKTFMRWIRFESMIKLHQLSDRLWWNTTNNSISERITKIIRDWLTEYIKPRAIFEEESVSKDGSLGFPVILYARDLLRGENMNNSVVECFRGIPHEDMKKVSQDILDKTAVMNSAILPNVPGGQAKAVSKFLCEVSQDTHSLSIYFGQGFNPPLLALLYSVFTRIQSNAYDPARDFYTIPTDALSTLIYLIQAQSTSAAFSFLIMYSIRCRTMTDHPKNINSLFDELPEPEKREHDIGKPIVRLPPCSI